MYIFRGNTTTNLIVSPLKKAFGGEKKIPILLDRRCSLGPELSMGVGRFEASLGLLPLR